VLCYKFLRRQSRQRGGSVVLWSQTVALVAKVKGTGMVSSKTIDYIIVNHTELDHSGLLEDMLQLAPRATVLVSKVALQFLEGFICDRNSWRIVKTDAHIDIGKGH
jgi:flavorubredoxin